MPVNPRLTPRETESKAQMLVHQIGYVIPPEIQGLARERIIRRANEMRENNDIIVNRVPAEVTQEPSTMGGKSKKSKKNKKSKNNKKSKTRR